jgi:hypothetical protein
MDQLFLSGILMFLFGVVFLFFTIMRIIRNEVERRDDFIENNKKEEKEEVKIKISFKESIKMGIGIYIGFGLAVLITFLLFMMLGMEITDFFMRGIY